MPEWLLTLIRSVFSFMILLIMARLMGKKQISQLTFFDYVVGITIGSIAAVLAVDQSVKIFNGFIGLLIWGGFPILISWAARKSYFLRRVFDGKPTVLIQNGNLLEKNLGKTNMTADELMLGLREKNVFRLADVEFAVLETNGKLSVMKKKESQPVTPKILGMMTEQELDPRIVVIDGQVMERTLREKGYSKGWLLGELTKQGATGFDDVFLAQLDGQGNVYVDLYQDRFKLPQVKQKPLLAASLKKVQADLEKFSLQTENEEAKAMYSQQADNLQQLIDEVEPYLKE